MTKKLLCSNCNPPITMLRLYDRTKKDTSTKNEFPMLRHYDKTKKDKTKEPKFIAIGWHCPKCDLLILDNITHQPTKPYIPKYIFDTDKAYDLCLTENPSLDKWQLMDKVRQSRERWEYWGKIV